MLAFRVSDTGIGIAPQHLETVFGAFQQADGTTSRKYGGTGLGLSISREIAYLLGGAITAESVLGSGSTFTLFLPVTRPEFLALEAGPRADAAVGGPAAADLPHQVSEEGGTALQPRRLLVVEDRQGGLLSLVAENATAEPAGLTGAKEGRRRVEVVTAVGAAEAAAVLASAPSHCVVLDLDLPDGAAPALLRDMDRDPALQGVPVLVHSNRGTPGDADALSRAGARPLEVISSLDELRERIALHMSADHPGDVPLVRGTPQDATWEAAGVDSALSGRLVLVVDDDDRNLYAITGILELHGMRVLQAENGRAALETLAANPGIDVILMDVMMPEMDGYTATAAIRAMPRYAALPIIAVTAKAMVGDREKSLASGASDYITKPVDAGELIGRIEAQLTE